jgi:predicted nucleic acid-binding protein
VVPYDAAMGRYVIDAATLVHLVTHQLQVDPAHQLVAPNSIRSEALEMLLGDVVAGRSTDQEALALHTRLTEAKMRLLGDRVSRATAWRIAREHGWDTLRHAEYLAITKLQADALITVDPELASRAADVVPVAPLADLLTSEPA